MKRTTILGKTLLALAVVGLSFGTVSCKDEKKPEDPKEVAEDQNEIKFDENRDKEKDSEHLVDLASIDMKEVELSKLAQKSADADVKAFAKMMVDDHTKVSNELKSLAQRKNITLPTSLPEKGQEAFDDLNKKTGRDFDKKYAEMMVDGHEKAIDKLEKIAENGNDQEIRQWASNSLPTFRTHLEHAKVLKDKIDAKK